MTHTFHPDRMHLSRVGFEVALDFATDSAIDSDSTELVLAVDAVSPMPERGTVTLSDREIEAWNYLIEDYLDYVGMFPDDAQYVAHRRALEDARFLLQAEGVSDPLDLRTAYQGVTLQALEAAYEALEERGYDVATTAPSLQAMGIKSPLPV